MATDADDIKPLQNLRRHEIEALCAELYGQTFNIPSRREFVLFLLTYRLQEKAHGGMSINTGKRLRVIEAAPESDFLFRGMGCSPKRLRLASAALASPQNSPWVGKFESFGLRVNSHLWLHRGQIMLRMRWDQHAADQHANEEAKPCRQPHFYFPHAGFAIRPKREKHGNYEKPK
jgi:hypothetical protein